MAAGVSNDMSQSDSETPGIIFNIQRYSIHDGPGIRTTVFLKGCPLRCAWCSNPESQKDSPEIAHRSTLCIQCGKCIEACPKKAISFLKKKVVINRKRCDNCGKCVEVCVSGAMKMFGQKQNVGEVFRKIRKDLDFYRSSGGGVTISGGEPLCQSEFVAALFKVCQENGIDTCLETSGMASSSALQKILPYTSLILFDIKLSSPDAHRKWTKKSNTEIVRNFVMVAQSEVPVIMRIPMIPGINDTDVELEGTARIAQHAVKDCRQGKLKIDLLPYHNFGLGKYHMLGRRYRLKSLTAPSKAKMQSIKQFFESKGFECEIET